MYVQRAKDSREKRANNLFLHLYFMCLNAYFVINLTLNYNYKST